MAFVNKKKVTIGLTEEVSSFAKEKAKSIGMSMSVYIETLLRKEMEREKQND